MRARAGLNSAVAGGPARRALVALAGLFAALGLAFAQPAGAQAATPGSGLLLTLAARECPKYTDVAANRARNNIMESLRDLGPDTIYQPGEAINNKVELEQQPNCTPITGWKFTLGNSYKTKAVAGYWGALSIITGQLREPVETLAETPLLNNVGQTTGQNIKGAVTIELGQKEAELAKSGNSLWVQGGTPEDPILAKEHPEEYGFAALRCAIDNLNGDNVEWVGYPTGTKHVFCYAYYVTPPPNAGVITIRKKAINAPAGSKETFDFGGNVSYNPGGKFSIQTAPPSYEGQETFVRGETTEGAQPWTVNEDLPANWVLKGISCSSANAEEEEGEPESSFTVNEATREVGIYLAESDHATCTYENEFVPPPGKLTVRKLTLGGAGTFGFAVNPVTGKAAKIDLAATTLEEGIAVDAAPAPELAAGEYTIAETSKPAKARGTWTETAVGCDNGGSYQPGKPISVKLESSKTLVCSYTNELLPTASLAIHKLTEGGTGTFGYTITSENRPETEIAQSADVTREKESFLATGDPSNALFFEPYVMQEIAPPTATGHWELLEVNCEGTQLPFAAGRAVVDLNEQQAHRSCRFVNKFTKTPEPPEPEEETARLAISKSPERAVITLGEKAAYNITVKNLGPATARDVVVDDEMKGDFRFVSAQPSQGRCNQRLPLHCELGSILNGRRATIRVVVIPRRTGVYPNRAVAGLANPDPSFGGDSAHAKVRVHARRKRRPKVTG
jgi:uncharacterized repeat protein (TIGR01451 family)